MDWNAKTDIRVSPLALVLTVLMSWQEMVTKLVGSLAWPVAVVVLVLAFKTYIAGLLPDLESVEAPGFKARFQRKLEQIEDETRQMSGPSKRGAEQSAVEDAIRRTAEVSPRAQILEAWLELQSAVDGAARQLDQESDLVRNELVRRDPMRAARTLAEAGKLEPDELALVADLRGLRNSVVHERGVIPTVDDAVTFSLAARAVADKLTS